MQMDEVKYCGGCNRDKSVDDFHKSSRKSGLATQCKECINKRGRDWYASNKPRRQEAGAVYHQLNRDRARDRAIQRKYGITLAQYKEMSEAQGHVCAVCAKPERVVDYRTGTVNQLAVDHCHETGRVRGLLCYSCNRVLGTLGDT
jgi:hypothetical protein